MNEQNASRRFAYESLAQATGIPLKKLELGVLTKEERLKVRTLGPILQEMMRQGDKHNGAI